MPTPADLLPEDVLREIFTYSVQLPPEPRLFSGDYWSHFRPKGILILTHVCSRWRQIALSMPYLWSTIRISAYDRPNVQFMHEWLSRAAAVPRTLFIALEEGRGRRDILYPIHTIFASYPFRRLSVFAYRYVFQGEHNIDLPNQLLEHLEELNLDESRAMFPHDAKLPNLQSLSITAECPPGKFQDYSTTIPWSQIRHLTLSEVSVAPGLLFSVLERCRHLEYCKIEYPKGYHPNSAPFHKITLPNLQSFELSTYDRPQDHFFSVECIKRLVIPSVNILQLSLWNVDTLVYSRVIEQSGGMLRLHTLTLSERTADIGILLKLLPHLESLTVLRDLGSGIWQDPSTGKLGPRLKHISSPVDSVDASLDFLKNRYRNAMCQPQITHLQSATFTFSRVRHFWDVIWDALESNGRGPYQCLRWNFRGNSNHTYTLDDLEN